MRAAVPAKTAKTSTAESLNPNRQEHILQQTASKAAFFSQE
jgi:hypothetical protein